MRLTQSLACTALAICCSPSVLARAPNPANDLRAELTRLRAEQERIAEQQRQTDAKLRSLEAQLAAAERHDEPAAIAPQAVQVGTAREGSQPRLSVTGDLRLRYQGDFGEADIYPRHSSQVRGRIGVSYAIDDRLTVGARLATGDPDDPNSTDVQLSNFDDDLTASLDLAYLRWKLGDLQVAAGKIPQPFVRTDLVWDSDVNPQGIGAVYRHSLTSSAALRASALFFVVDEDAVAADSTMAGWQAGYDSAALGAWRYDVSVAYYRYRLGSVGGAEAGDFRSNLRNADGSYRSRFELGDVILGGTWSGAGDRWPIRLVADYVHNFGAATDADTGYSVDLAAGRLGQPGDWRLTYGYSVAETDAVLAAFSHDNIAFATHYQLHALTLDFALRPKTTVSAIWYRYAPYHTTDANANPAGDWLDRFRLAFLVGF